MSNKPLQEAFSTRLWKRMHIRTVTAIYDVCRLIGVGSEAISVTYGRGELGNATDHIPYRDIEYAYALE